MNKYTYIPFALVILALPVGSALADDGQHGSSERGDDSHSALILHAEGNSSVTIEDDTDVEVDASTTLHASGTPWMNGVKHGLEKHFGTTTPPGMMHHTATSTDNDNDEDNASSTHKQKGENNGHKNGPFASFWGWLLGHPASTTVADLKAELQASSTASTTGPGTEHAQGEGFFAHFLNFFRSKH